MRDWLLVGRELLDSHNLEHWQINWMRRKSIRVYARCRPRLRTIELNKEHFEQTAFTPILFDTILHEIAHAIDLESRHKTRHDSVWRAIYMKIGGTGKTISESITLK